MKIYNKIFGSVVLGASLMLVACGDVEQTAKKNDETTTVEKEGKLGNEKLFEADSIAEEIRVPKGQPAEVQFVEHIIIGDEVTTRTAKQTFTILESMRGVEAVNFYTQYQHPEGYVEYVLKGILKENPEYEMAIVKLNTTITDMKENEEPITEMPLLDFDLLKFRSEKSGDDPKSTYIELPVEMRINPLHLDFEADKEYTGYLIGMVKKGEEFFLYHQAGVFEDMSSTTAEESELKKNPITIFEVE